MIDRLGQSDRLVILKKPFDTIEVLQLTHALVEKWALAHQARLRMDQLEAMVAARTQELQATNEKLQFEMNERARTEEILRQTQKMEAVGQLAGGIAHDFNNLLTVIRGWTHCLTLETAPGTKAADALRQIDSAAERATRLTSQMLMFGRKTPLHPQSLNLNEILAEFGDMLRRLLGATITLEIETSERPLMIRADPVMVEMIFLNLALNSRDAMPNGGRLAICAAEIEIKPGQCQQQTQARPGKFACVSVADSGCGLAPEILPHLFEPFFTTKDVGKGTGLGLASAYGVVKQHAGWMEAESTPGHGATFKVFLPLEIPKPAPAPPRPAPTRPGGGHETILLVEDEAPVRRLAKLLLEHHGYRVHEAGNGQEALSIWAERQSEIDLLLTDMIMPGGCSGRELAEKIHADRDNIKILYTTGYSPDAFSEHLTLTEGVNFLGKPYSPAKLTQTVRHCLDMPVPA
jgi:two-component system cell cycle sensor histidine kinase/response regulator CckA